MLAESTEHRVIRALSQWLEAGQSSWLCTIIKTWGASPRPVGSVLAFHSEHGVVGSLSGGCIEETLIRKLAHDSEKDSAIDSPYLYEYEISVDDQVRYSLPCGGQLTIMVEFIRPDGNTIQHVNALLEALDNRQCVDRQVSMKDGTMSLSSYKKAKNNRTEANVSISEDIVSTSFGPVFKMLLLGAGDVSRYVAQIANTVDFSVTICDPRESYLQGFQSEGVELIQCLPDDLVRELFSDPYCAILALAHDPRVDDMALLEALKTEAFYVGAMGSSRTTQARHERLKSLGCSSEEMAKLHAPIGIDIGSKKPPEIAISVMAQVLAERHQFLNS